VGWLTRAKWPAWIAKQTKLNGKAKPVPLPAPFLDVLPILFGQQPIADHLGPGKEVMTGLQTVSLCLREFLGR
jgi:hypothetical protein